MPGGGGLLQLVAQGKQDVFLTGNPQVTWFKMVYRRYTNFAIESQQLYFDGTADFGKRVTCLIPRRGDLLGPMLLEISLPTLTLTTGKVVPYVNSVGHALIEEISIEIGEQEIDKQTGEWMEVWNQLTIPAGQRAAYDIMVGRVEGLNDPQSSDPTFKVYVPLQFWFNRNPGQYLPLLALQYHPIRLNLKLRPLQDLFYIAAGSGSAGACSVNEQVNRVTLGDISLWGDYVYLDKEERRRFVANSHEYLIEQVQYTMPVAIPSDTLTQNVRLEFNHPLRELIWLVQRDVMISNHEWFNFGSITTGEQGIPRNLLASAKIQVDGYDRFEERDGNYFRLVQPYQYHTNIPLQTYVYVYSFALRPEDSQPNGSLNASRIDNMILQLTMQPDSTAAPGASTYSPPRGNARARVYARNHNVLRVVNGFGGLLFSI